MKLGELVAVSRDVARVSARTAKIERLAELLTRLGPDEIPIAVSYLAGELGQGRIGVGWATLAPFRDLEPAREPTLTLLDTDAAFGAIAAQSGKGRSRERERLLGELFTRATTEERDFLVRLVIGELRQGALEGVLQEAIARAARVPPTLVRRALLFAGDLRAVARAALLEGEPGLRRFSVELFRPLSPMLAQPADGLTEALLRIESAALEYKLDGARIQVHRAGEDVRAFSRSGHDVTAFVPELAAFTRSLPAKEILLDGEALVLRPDGRPEPFQTTMRRFGKRRDIEALVRELPLSSFFFDCLYVDGQPLVDAPNAERHRALVERVPESARVPRIVVTDPAEADRFLERALAAGHEGLLAKNPSSPYEAGRRAAQWLKIKVPHTLDLVVLAVEWGSGRRTGYLSNIHLGARDPESGGFAMLGKTFKGMTDAMLAWQTEQFQKLALRTEGHVVHLRPEMVVEVAFDGVQESPHYASGLALRFARVLRYRPDKTPDQADTLDTVRGIHRAANARDDSGSSLR
ncbi:MAG: ATP-dependent DNA ligase [Pseudomonadota bacterium]|nr:MAG: ATP-dependent DNA ligase [Pseudomonadota bacterium]